MWGSPRGTLLPWCQHIFRGGDSQALHPLVEVLCTRNGAGDLTAGLLDTVHGAVLGLNLQLVASR